MRTFVVGVILSVLASTIGFAQTGTPPQAPPAEAPPAGAPATGAAPAAAPTEAEAPSATPPAESPTPAGDIKPRAVPLAPSPIVLDDLPPACRELGKLAQSPSRAAALSARLSLANCLVEPALRALQLCDCEQSVKELETATEKSFALTDDVFLFGDPVQKILARQAQGDLLTSLATRMMATIPALIDTSEAAVQLREMRLQLLRPLIDPWIARAKSAYMELDKIAKDNPQLAKNAAVLAAVRSSRAKLTQVHATR